MRLLKALLPVCQSAKTDNIMFKLSYRYTVLTLLLFSFVITCRLLFGNSFVCSTDTNVIDAYCYTHGTFIFSDTLSKNMSTEVPYPGIGKSKSSPNSIVRVSYYPWVNLFFLLLAILFYLPHLIWKIFEGGLMTRLTSKVNNSSISETERKAAIVETAKYVITTQGGHILYTVIYVSTEILNWLVGVLLTVWFVNFFNVKMYFSSDEFEMETWDDFFAYNFPLMGKCRHTTYGASGVIQINDFVCHLPLNNLYGYMFLFLYAWFILLCVLQAHVVLYRLLALALPPTRLLLFRLRSGAMDQTLMTFVDSTFSVGDWFLLTRLQKNLLAHDLTKLLYYVQQNFDKNRLDLEMNDLSKVM